MNKIFLFYKPTIASGWNIFYSHLLTGVISSKKCWRVENKLMLVSEGVILLKFSFYEILTKIQTKKINWIF